MKYSFSLLNLLLLVFSANCQLSIHGVQTNSRLEFRPLVTLDTLVEAKAIKDIYSRYPEGWVAGYQSVKISTICDGATSIYLGADDKLTHDQLLGLKLADASCTIEIEVDYIPDNTLTYNPPRKMNYSLRIVPIYEAKYPGGRYKLNQYMRKQTYDKISKLEFAQLEMAAARFDVNKSGEVVNARLTRSSDFTHIDELILNAINNMPNWSPARNSKGQKISQEFEFRIGTNLLRCDYQY